MITIDSKGDVYVVNDGLTPGLPAQAPFYNIFTPIGFSLKTEILNPILAITEPPIIKVVNPWTYWTNDEKLNSVRLQRNYLLAQTDWTALNDVPLSPSEKTAYENYRQQLRDFPDTVNVNLPIEQIIWPTKP